MKGELQLNETSDWYIKLLPSLFPWAGIPGSPQNFIYTEKYRAICRVHPRLLWLFVSDRAICESHPFQIYTPIL